MSLFLFVTSLYPLKDFHCFIICLLYVTITSLQCFHCFIVCLLHHRSVKGFDCYFLGLLRDLTISSRFPLFYYLFIGPLLCSILLRLTLPLFVMSPYNLFNVCIISLSVCYVTALFEASTVSSSVLLRQFTIFSRLPLFHLFVTSVLCSRLRLSRLLFVTSSCFLLKVSLDPLSVCYVTALF